MSEVLNVEKLFGENVFTLGKMQERLPKKAFAEVKRVMEHLSLIHISEPTRPY